MSLASKLGITGGELGILKALGAMSYGYGSREEQENGGKGVLGIHVDLEGRVRLFKCLTHDSSASIEEKANANKLDGLVDDSCRLRSVLLHLGSKLKIDVPEELKKSYQGDGNQKGKSLVARTVGASFIKKVADKLTEDEKRQLWDVDQSRKSTGDMSYEARKDTGCDITDAYNKTESIKFARDLLKNILAPFDENGKDVFSPLNGLMKLETAERKTVEAYLSVAVQELTNSELHDIYEKLWTDQYRQLFDALSDDAKGHMFTLDGLITRELGYRAFQTIAPDPGHESTVKSHGGSIVSEDLLSKHASKNDLPSRNMLALANVGVTSGGAKNGAMMTELPSITGFKPEQIGKAGEYLRQKTLTMNVKADFFLSSGGPLAQLNGTWKNLFHADEEGKPVKDKDYIAKRKCVEDGFYPEFDSDGKKAEGKVAASERPIYAAVNINGRKDGECNLYGSVAVKFKQHVNRRAVYTVRDSFNTLSLKLDHDKFSEQFDKNLLSEDGLKKIEACTKGDYANQLVFDRRHFKSPVSDADIIRYNKLLVECSTVTNVPRKGNMATWNNIESLLPAMSYKDVYSLVNAANASADTPFQLTGEEYIEAQIHGGFSLLEDVEEITINLEGPLSTSEVEKIDKNFARAVAAVLNGKNPTGTFYGEKGWLLGAIKKALNGKTIKCTIIENADDANAPQSKRVQQKDLYENIANSFDSDSNFCAKLLHDSLGLNLSNLKDIKIKFPEGLSAEIIEAVKQKDKNRRGYQPLREWKEHFIETTGTVLKQRLGDDGMERLKALIDNVNKSSDVNHSKVADDIFAVLEGRKLTDSDMSEMVNSFGPNKPLGHDEKAFPNKDDAKWKSALTNYGNESYGWTCVGLGSTWPHYIDYGGKRYFVKKAGLNTQYSKAAVRNEVNANNFLRLAGLNAPDSQYMEVGDDCFCITVGCDLSGGGGDIVKDERLNETKIAEQVKEAYPIMSLLYNMDIMQSNGNAYVDKDGNALFLDNGSTFGFSAQGERNKRFDFDKRADPENDSPNFTALANFKGSRSAANWRKAIMGDSNKDVDMETALKEAAKYNMSALVAEAEKLGYLAQLPSNGKAALKAYAAKLDKMSAPYKRRFQIGDTSDVRGTGTVKREYTQFPKPKDSTKLPSDFEGRRKHLLSMLPTYYTNELPADEKSGREKGFDHGTGVHSRGHICRAFIFSEVMANIMEERGYEIDRGALTIGIVGHDSGRTKNGRDEEEEQSVDRTLSEAKKLYGEDVMGDQYEAEIKKCIVNHESTTLEGELLNSADSLDIGRIKDFDMRYFAFLKSKTKGDGRADTMEDEKIRSGLQKEAMLLAELTDPSCVGRKKYRKYVEEYQNKGLRDEQKYDEAMAAWKDGEKKTKIQQSNGDHEQFLQMIEDTIKNQPTKFPLLHKYYINKK